MEAHAAVDRYKPRGLTRVLRAVGASVRGLLGAYREEAAFRQELAFVALVIPLGLWLGHTGVERALLIAPALLILIVAALGGFFLASFHARKQLPPRAVVFIHAGVAVIGFLLLAGGAFSLL